MTIEQRLLHDYGRTAVPELCVWMLKDGTMVNGSYGGFQRDVDHHEINSYFKRSVREDPGSSGIYVIKFMRRGNLRVGCSKSARSFEVLGTPTREQMNAVTRFMSDALEQGVETCVGIRRPHENTKWMTFPAYLRYLDRYAKLPLTSKEQMLMLEYC